MIHINPCVPNLLVLSLSVILLCGMKCYVYFFFPTRTVINYSIVGFVFF